MPSLLYLKALQRQGRLCVVTPCCFHKTSGVLPMQAPWLDKVQNFYSCDDLPSLMQAPPQESVLHGLCARLTHECFDL